MSGNPIYDYVTSTAVSLTMAGNTGISPFLTLFLLGVIEMIQPEWLNMGPTMELLLASWWSVAILGTLAVAEMVGKCIPAIDEVIDSAEVFVVPVISVLATMATMGLLPVSEGAQDDAGLGQNIDVMGLFDGNDAGVRNLEEAIPVDADAAAGDAFGDGFLTFTKVVLVIAGIGLSLAIHFFKMIVRVSSLACSGGCCQPCITIVEYLLVIVGVILALLAPAFAVIACVAFLGFAAYAIWKKCSKKKNDEAEDDAARGKNAKTGSNQNGDLEDQSPPVNDSPNPPAEAFVVPDGMVDVPLAPTEPKDWDVEAKVY